jgi:hypothetical protein
MLFATVTTGAITWEFSDAHLLLTGIGAALGGLIVGPIVLLLGSLNLKINNLLRRVNETEASLREMTNIRPLLKGPPLDYGGWAMDPHLGKTLAQVIYRHEPNHIVECGSGTSTVFMARCLDQAGVEGNVLAIDHLEEFASKTRALSEDHGLAESIRVVTAPLEEKTLADGTTQPWYGIGPQDFEDELPIELLVVDGPPSDTAVRARYPALPVLKDACADDCVVVLDDGGREEERSIAQDWAEQFGMDASYVSGGKGGWILHK